MRLTSVIALAVVATLLWEVAPPAMQHLGILSRRIDERKRFVTDDMDHMVRKYPTFMTKVAEETVDELSRGTWAPVLERAWDNNSWVCLVRGVRDWVANNFVVRILSPQTPWECAGLVALLFCVAVVSWGLLNLFGSMYMANTMRLNAEAKRMASTPKVVLSGDD